LALRSSISAPKADTTPEHRDREVKGGGAALGDLLQILLDRAREVNRLDDDNAAFEAFLKQMQKAGTYIFESFPNTDSLHSTLLATLSQ
jgi:chaperonin GroEL (HSP60 family)